MGLNKTSEECDKKNYFKSNFSKITKDVMCSAFITHHYDNSEDHRELLVELGEFFRGKGARKDGGEGDDPDANE